MNEIPAGDPLVSCLMPTANRAAFVPHAIACFLAQDFPDRELLVLDNGGESIEHLLPPDPRIRYHRAPPALKLGELRNRACELARGEFLVHWDDDDWYPPDRISRQVERLRSGADLCATSRVYFLASDGARAWEFHSGGPRPWLAGSSFAYTRAAWRRRGFEPIRVGEDSRFAASVPRERIVDLADPGLVIATVHAGNTSPKRPNGTAWRVTDAGTVRALKAGPAPAADGAQGVPQADAAGGIAPPGRRIVVGVDVANDPGRLAATLEALHENTNEPFELVLLGGEEGARSGPAAAFNQLVRGREADVYVYLQSGSLVGPQWLARLRAALDAHPTHGLAGPTTNMAWSVQGEFRGRPATDRNVALLAREAAARFGDAWRTLEPLYCLADFCFALKRAVVDAIGGADEGYGAGPCWEMDYAVRAARAGFGVVWASGAYVFRHAFTAQRNLDEQAWLEPNKARYQRKFCGLLLAGARQETASHCRGTRCAHFAPPASIVLRLEAGEPAPAVGPLPVTGPTGPLVTCIMPTQGRPEWVQQAILYFQRQTYGPRELVIVDNSAAPMEGLLPCDPRIRYVHRRQRMTIGAMRNLACEMAQGELIAHWDDDDWHGAGRLAAQVAPILAGSADITALSRTPFYDVSRGQSWTCSAELFARMFVYAVHGGTLVYARRLFVPARRFPNVSIAEDAAFLAAVVRGGARLAPVDAGGHFVYVRHGQNAWRFACGQAVDAAGWCRVADSPWMGEDLPFYLARREGLRRQA